MEAAFSHQHSANSQKQELFTAKDAEDAKESKQNQHQNLFNTEDTAESKTLPLIHGKPGDEQGRVKQRAEAMNVCLKARYSLANR